LDKAQLRDSKGIALDGKTADDGVDVLRLQNRNKLVNVIVVNLDDIVVILNTL
jgi:hypothetical protein